MKNLFKKFFGLGAKAENVTTLSEEERHQHTEQFAQKQNTPLFSGSVQHLHSQQRIKNTSTCPNCEAATEKKTALYACATDSITQFIISNDGYFCTNCRTAIIDDKTLQNACEKGKLYRGVLGFAKGERIETYESLNEYIVRYSYDQKGRPNAMKITNQKVEIQTVSTPKENFKKQVQEKTENKDYQQSKERFKNKTNQQREEFKNKHNEKRTFKPKTNQKPVVENPQQEITKPTIPIEDKEQSIRRTPKKNYRSKRKPIPNNTTSSSEETPSTSVEKKPEEKSNLMRASQRKQRVNYHEEKTEEPKTQTTPVEKTPIDNQVQEPQPELVKEKSSRLARLQENQDTEKPSSRRPRRNVRPPIDLDLKPTNRGMQRRRPNNTKNK